MKRNRLNLTLLGVFTIAGIGTATPAPAQDPGTEGQWGAVLNLPIKPIHMIVLKNKKVLAFDFLAGGNPNTRCILFDPPRCVGGTNDTLPCNIDADCPGGVCTYNVTSFDGPADPNRHRLLSSGHAALADGKIFFTGSWESVPTTTLYDPDVDPPGPASWMTQDDGSGGPAPTKRFYPTCTTLGDGTVLVTAGRHFSEDNFEANTPAIFDPTQPAGQQWRSLTNATYADRVSGNCPSAGFHLDQYPFMFLLSTGETVYTGSDDSGNTLWSTRGTWSLDTQSEVWTELVPEPQDTILGGSAVMYRPDRIMKAGGRGGDCLSAIASVFTLDATAANPEWTQRPSMANARKNHIHLLVLPDGNILATNGQNAAGDVLVPELYDPDPDPGSPDPGWQPMAPMTDPRGHHATAVLLPDARVLVAGGVNVPTAQIFSPPYLFLTGGAPAVRPTIDAVDGPVSCGFPTADIIGYGKTFTVTTAQALNIAAVSLIRPGGATHGFDFEQRFIDLTFTSGAGQLSVTEPSTPDHAPPGYYMLFILDNSGVPSVAKIIKLDRTCLPLPPTAAPAPHDILKNRYISIDPRGAGGQNFGKDLDIRLTLTSTLVNGVTAIGSQWWANAPGPDNNDPPIEQCISIVGPTRPVTPPNWDACPTLHLTGCPIMPTSSYDIVMIDGGAASHPPLAAATQAKPGALWWGDCVGNFTGPGGTPPNVWTAPQGVTNINDVFAALKTFIDPNALNATHVSVTDVVDLGPNRKVNINDAFTIILGFQGHEYPFGCPDDPCWDTRPIADGGQGPCPGGSSGGSGGGSAPLGPATVSTLSLLASTDLILQGELIDVEVFLDVADDLGGYQLDLEVTGGDTGSLDLENLFIDDTRSDYVFFGVNSLESVSSYWGQVGAANLNGVGIPVVGPAYLGTFQFRASPDAVGVFTIRFEGIEDNFLMNGNAFQITDAITDDEAFIGVEVECAIDSHCDDSNACTDDTCNNGTCLYTNDDTNTCTDGNDCTDDACVSGTCISTNDDTNTCTDGNDCTADSCLSGVCTSTNEPVNTTCDDGLFCTKRDKCDGAGVCVGTGNPCFGQNPVCCEYNDTCGPLPCI